MKKLPFNHARICQSPRGLLICPFTGNFLPATISRLFSALISHPTLNHKRLGVQLQTIVAVLLGCVSQARAASVAHSVVEPEPEQEDRLTLLKKRLPRWNWNQTASDFSWTSTARIHHPEGWLASLDPRDLSAFFDFTSSLEWYVQEEACTAYIEFSFLFWKRGYVLRSCASADTTFRDLNFWLRRVLVFINKISNDGVFPGAQRGCVRIRNEGDRKRLYTPNATFDESRAHKTSI